MISEIKLISWFFSKEDEDDNEDEGFGRKKLDLSL